MLYGDLINNTGTAQDLTLMNGTFYDDQGQVMPDRPKFVSWPIETVAQGGRVPFELTVDGIYTAVNFKLDVEAEPSSQSPHQNIEFLDSNQRDEEGAYCVEGKLRSPGNSLRGC